jgi:hypothetical protein
MRGGGWGYERAKEKRVRGEVSGFEIWQTVENIEKDRRVRIACVEKRRTRVAAGGRFTTKVLTSFCLHFVLLGVHILGSYPCVAMGETNFIEHQILCEVFTFIIQKHKACINILCFHKILHFKQVIKPCNCWGIQENPSPSKRRVL